MSYLNDSHVNIDLPYCVNRICPLNDNNIKIWKIVWYTSLRAMDLINSLSWPCVRINMVACGTYLSSYSRLSTMSWKRLQQKRKIKSTYLNKYWNSVLGKLLPAVILYFVFYICNVYIVSSTDNETFNRIYFPRNTHAFGWIFP